MKKSFEVRGSQMKKFITCKLCLIFFGSLLAILTQKTTWANQHKYPQVFDCEGQDSPLSGFHQDYKIRVSIGSKTISVNHLSASKPYVHEYNLHSFEVDGFKFLVGKRVGISGRISLSENTLVVANGTLFVDLAGQTVITDNYNFRPSQGASSLEERGAFWIKYRCSEK